MKTSRHLNSKLVSRLSRPLTNTSITNKISTRGKYSSSFDPYWTLHYQTVTRDQQEAFRQVWENDIGGFKKDLTIEEIKQFQRKVDESDAIDEFEVLMKGLWGPDRHDWIRKTSTYEYTKNTLFEYISSNNNPSERALSLIIGDNDNFNTILLSSGLQSNDTEGYLRDFSYADLRYLCSCIGFDYLNGPKITIVFGNRRQYHFELPTAIGRTAHWQTAVYDRCHVNDLVMLTTVHALKEKNGKISQNYIKKLLDADEFNALKDETWRPYAERQLIKSEEEFLDDFDRAFNAFQTDPGVTKLKTRFPTDWDRFKI